MNEIRTLRADEIECRVATVKGPSEKKSGGCSLLLYKDARCDMRILDEVFGPMNWMRTHEEIGGRLYCSIAVRDPETGNWVPKQDVGTESYTEKEKGQASDSFKRAGFNWGIGRELYTAPFIWVQLANDEMFQKGQSWSVKTSFHVDEIDYNDRHEITRLVIKDKNGNARFSMVKEQPDKEPENPPLEKRKIGEAQLKALCGLCTEILGNKATKGEIRQLTGLEWSAVEQLNVEDWQYTMEVLNKKLEAKMNHDA